eukprot:5577238-Amphidinium_carterae.1
MQSTKYYDGQVFLSLACFQVIMGVVPMILGMRSAPDSSAADAHSPAKASEGVEEAARAECEASSVPPSSRQPSQGKEKMYPIGFIIWESTRH